MFKRLIERWKATELDRKVALAIILLAIVAFTNAGCVTIKRAVLGWFGK